MSPELAAPLTTANLNE